MIYLVKINDKEYEVEVERGKANIIRTVEVPSAQNSSETPAASVHQAPSAPAVPVAGTVPEGTVVRAPMPGTILDLKVAVGQQIKQGGLLLVLEAMKMENEVLAPDSGTIKQVLVTKGASVATDDILIVIN